jgi:hypothetical protein
MWRPAEKSVIEVAKNALDEGKMQLLRVMHEGAHLLDRIGQVGVGESKVP